MAEAPSVSVIIPTYNNADLLLDGVESVLDQTVRPSEVIVVDDGSTDNTLQRLERFGSGIQIIRREHRGPAVARNAGIRVSSGEVVAFLDSDDLWMPEKLERCVNVLQEKPEAGVVYTALRIHELGTGLRYQLPQYTQSGWMARDLFVECRGVNTSTLVVRRECLDAAGLFDEEFFRAQDWDLMVRLAEAFQYAHVPETLTERRLHSRSLSVTHAHLYKKYNLLVLDKALARRPDLYEDVKDRAYSLAHLRFGMNAYGEFRLSEARAEFRQALSHEWTWRAFNYRLRACLPTSVVCSLRSIRLAFRSGGRGRRLREKSHV